MDKLKISYIITAYNLEKYIAQCIESVMPNIMPGVSELLIIDDGSTDSTAEMVDSYVRKHPEIRVIHQRNTGVAEARNVGCREALGEWLCYLDGDDYLIKEKGNQTLTKVALPYLKDNLDILFFDRLSDDEDGSFVLLYDALPYMTRSIIYDSYTFKQGKLYEKVHITTPWGKFYRKDFLVKNDLWNVVGVVLAQDIIFNMMVYAKSPRMAAINKRYYFHRILFDSNCHKYRPNYFNISMKFIEAMKEIIAEYYESDSELVKLSYASIVNLIANNCILNLCNQNNKKSFEEREKDFEKLISVSQYNQAVEQCDIGILNELHRTVLTCVRKRDFRYLDKIIKKYERKRRRVAFLQNKAPLLVRIGVKIKHALRV